MKPVDKFGNDIYPNKYNKMLAHGQVLQQHGYTESLKKPNLFYRVDKAHEGVIYFADMRDTSPRGDTSPIWPDSYNSLNSPWFYVNFKVEYPRWLKSRLAGEEFNSLKICIERYHEEGEGEYDINCRAGYCERCGVDIQGDSWHCSSCQKALAEASTALTEASREICPCCSKSKYPGEFVEHHTSYTTGKTIRICRNCHTIVHKTDKYPDLKPVDERPKRPKSKPLPLCSICNSKTTNYSQDGEPVRCASCHKVDKKKFNHSPSFKPKSSWWPGSAWGSPYGRARQSRPVSSTTSYRTEHVIEELEVNYQKGKEATK